MMPKKYIRKRLNLEINFKKVLPFSKWKVSFLHKKKTKPKPKK